MSQEKDYQLFCEYYQEDTFNILHNSFNNQKKEISSQEYYKLYQKVVTKTAEFLRSMPFKDPYTITIAYEYLLWKGYLSNNHHLEYSISNRSGNLYAAGMDILNGHSVCLNNAEFLARLLRELKYEAYIVGCKGHFPHHGKYEYRPKITRNINKKINKNDYIKNIILQLNPFNHFGNHAVTLFKNNNHYQVADPTGLLFGEFTDFLHFKYVGSKVTMQLKPWLMISLEDISYEDFHQIIKSIKKQECAKPLDVPHIRESTEIVLGTCYRRNDIFEDFHQEILPDISKINKSLTYKPKQ